MERNAITFGMNLILALGLLLCASPIRGSENEHPSRFFDKVSIDLRGHHYKIVGKVHRKDDGFSSELCIRDKRDNGQVVWKSDVRDAIGLKVIEGQSINRHFSDLVFLIQERGALAESINVVSLSDETVTSLLQLVATEFEFKLIKKRAYLLVHYDENALDVPAFFDYQDGKMVDVSSDLGDYYIKVLKTLPYSCDTVPDGLERAYAKLVKLAKREHETIDLLKSMQDKNDMSEAQRVSIAKILKLLNEK